MINVNKTQLASLRGIKNSEPPKSIKVLITGKLHKIALEILRQPPKELSVGMPIDVCYLPDCSRENVLKEVVDSHVLVTRSETDVDESILKAGDHLSIVARAAVGYSNINVEMATEMGVLVINTPGKNTNSAAELTMGLLLSVARKIPGAHVSTSKGGWNRHEFSGFELAGRTIGIVGLGNVGHRVAKFARGFDMRVMAYDPYIADEVFRQHGCERIAQLDQLMKDSDVVSVHVPLNKETKNMITEQHLRLMKKGSLAVNAARGGVINEAALLKLLNEGHLAGAGIDTWDSEPAPMKELVGHPQVVSTPHIGASTLEAQYRIGETIAIQILKALRGEICDYPVNLPHVTVLGSGTQRRYAVLAEKLTSIARQLLDFSPVGIRVLMHEAQKDVDLQLVRLSALRGFLSDSSDEFVSYVNAERILARRELKMETKTSSQDVRHNGVVIEVYGAKSEEKCRVGAILYDTQIERLYMIDDFVFEIEPTGELLAMKNHDRPGVIGDVGTYLGKCGVNIAQFDLSRNRLGGTAMSLLRIDTAVNGETLEGLAKVKNIISVKRIAGL